MSKPQKQRTPEFKLKIVLESLKGDKSITQLAAEHQIHPKQIQRWRQQLLQEGENIFLKNFKNQELLIFIFIIFFFT